MGAGARVSLVVSALVADEDLVVEIPRYTINHPRTALKLVARAAGVL
jgi:hypothetical protein